MDRSSFLKALAMGAATSPLIAACSNNDSDGNSIIEPDTNDGMVKSAGKSDVISKNYDIILQSHECTKYYLNKVKQYDSLYIYRGYVESADILNGKSVGLIYNSNSEVPSFSMNIATLLNDADIFSIMVHCKASGYNTFYGCVNVIFNLLFDEKIKIIAEGNFPGMNNAFAKPAAVDIPEMELDKGSLMDSIMKNM